MLVQNSSILQALYVVLLSTSYVSSFFSKTALLIGSIICYSRSHARLSMAIWCISCTITAKNIKTLFFTMHFFFGSMYQVINNPNFSLLKSQIRMTSSKYAKEHWAWKFKLRLCRHCEKLKRERERERESLIVFCDTCLNHFRVAASVHPLMHFTI